MNLISSIINRLQGSQTTSHPIESSPTFTSLISKYEQALNSLLTNNQASLLSILLIRDHIKIKLEKSDEIQEIESKKLIALDEVLRNYGRKHNIKEMYQWRSSFQKPKEDWWWFLDQPVDFPDNNPIPEIISATFVIIAGILFADIIKRLWDTTSDQYSILWTILVLLFTTSPFIKRFREVLGFFVKKIKSTTYRQNQIMVGLSIFVLIVAFVIRFLALPGLAYIENIKGAQLAADGNLKFARIHLDRAVAINSKYTAAYYNLANVYEESGATEKAISLYENVIDQDNSMVPAYINLGRLLIDKGDTKRALSVLYAGYKRIDSVPADKKDELEYKLLSYIGLVYYLDQEPEMAEFKFNQAIELENTIPAEIKEALPHYYLAFILEDRGKLDEALQNFESSKRYLQATDPESWELTLDQHLIELRRGK